MVTSKELQQEIQNRVDKIVEDIWTQIENKLDSNREDVIRALISEKRIYISLSYLYKKEQNKYGYDDYTITWMELIEKATKILEKKLSKYGWKISENNFLEPLEETSEEIATEE